MPRRPYFKFYGNDYSADDRLSMCSLAAQGLWTHMIIAMEAADPRGHLISGIRAFTESDRDLRDFAVLIRRPVKEVITAFSDLKRNKVYSTTAEGVIFCRGIVRRADRERKAAEDGKRGGNPLLLLTAPLRVGVNGELYTDDIPHARESITTPNTTPSLPTVETSSPDRKSESWRFAIWFYEQGREVELVPAHILPNDAGYRDIDQAEALITAHGREKCEEVARRFIASSAERKKNGEAIKRYCLRSLSEMWTLFETDRPPARPAKSAAHFDSETAADEVERAVMGRHAT